MGTTTFGVGRSKLSWRRWSCPHTHVSFSSHACEFPARESPPHCSSLTLPDSVSPYLRPIQCSGFQAWTITSRPPFFSSLGKREPCPHFSVDVQAVRNGILKVGCFPPKLKFSPTYPLCSNLPIPFRVLELNPKAPKKQGDHTGNSREKRGDNLGGVRIHRTEILFSLSFLERT